LNPPVSLVLALADAEVLPPDAAVDDSSVFHLTATQAVLIPNMAMHIPILVDI